MTDADYIVTKLWEQQRAHLAGDLPLNARSQYDYLKHVEGGQHGRAVERMRWRLKRFRTSSAHAH